MATDEAATEEQNAGDDPERDAYVQSELERFKNRVTDDDRRHAAFVVNAEARFYQRKMLAKAVDSRVVSDLTYKLQMNNEQFARIVQLDIKSAVDASRLHTAAAILDYMGQCREVLESAENRLRVEAPEEFQRLQKTLAQRKAPTESAADRLSGPQEPTSPL